MSDIAYDIIKESIGSLTEDEGLNIIIAIEQQFGFAGTTFTREDAEREWRMQQDATGDTPLPDEVWERVQDTWEWRKGLSEILTERGWGLVADAVTEALK